MRLTKLEVAGFKSFAKRTELQFGSGITAVIGPNGSGKSNISDAVRWVLGEQSARALRGTKMEDVIFNGTQTRKPQSMCEVTLTFDNSDQKLPVEFNEVAVTRRMYRSGESEYVLNGKTCRLKDIMELFRDTGIGKDGYSIISQGKVDEILSNKSSDRRVALEEAAGVTRYRARKEEAERKLDATEKNMERLLDLLNELETRLGPLEEQSATARTFLRLREELKDLDVNMFLYQTDRQKERLNTLRETVEQLSSELSDNEAHDRELSEQSGTLEAQVRELDEQLSEQQNRLIEMLSGVEAHVGESNLLVERRDYAKKETERIGKERDALKAQVLALETDLTATELSETEWETRNAMDREISEGDAAVARMDAEIAERESALDAAKNAMMEAMNRLADARSDASRFETMVASLKERLNALDGEEAAAKEKLASLQKELEAADKLRADAEQTHNEHIAAYREAQSNRYSIESDLLVRQEELRIAEQNAGALSSRGHVLRDMMRSHEGYQNSVRLVMQASDRDEQLKKCIIGPVAELLRVPKEYETAIGMSLGGSMQNLVTRSAEEGKAVIEYARKNDLGRITLLPVSMLTPNPLNERERAFLKENGVIGVASELITCDPGLAVVADYLLGRTVVVKDLESGIALKKKSKNAFHIATLLGDFLSTGGTMTGGSVKKNGQTLGLPCDSKEHAKDVLADAVLKLGKECNIDMNLCSIIPDEKAFMSKIEEISKQRKAAEKAVLKKQEEIETCKQQIVLADTQLQALLQEAHADELELVRQNEQREIILRDWKDAEQSISDIADERTDIGDSIADIERRREASQSVQAEIEQSNTASRTEIIVAQQSLNALRTAREAENAALTERKIARMALQKEDDARTAERNRLTRDRALAMQRIEDYENEYRSMTEQIETAQERLSEMERSIAGEQTDLQAAKDEQQRLEKERQRTSELLARYRQRRDELAEAYREAGERKHKGELAIDRIELECRQMADRIFQDYELTYENALPLRREIPIGATNSRINELKSQIRELGEINVSAIEDYRTVSERYESMKTQYDDLEKAKADLFTLIAQITRQMEATFTAEFARVQESFSEVFVKLFGGGHAELRLSDKNDVLNCDIDIIAQPPGKKLQLLSLLSGGERALTAIALLFAMLKIKAPAFCVLDEIETSLDEENVSRFAEYLTQYSDETQFIIITHRKGSMEVCDTLYGVAMEEKGVSTIVSARFD